MKKLLNLFLTLSCMLLACYTPYSFSSAIFGTIEPSGDQILQAREDWLTNEIIEAMDSDLHQRIIDERVASRQLDMILRYFTTLYAQTDYTAFSERQEWVLRSILQGEPTTLDIINSYSQDFYTANPYPVFGPDPEPVTANNATTTHIPLRFHSFSTNEELTSQALR